MNQELMNIKQVAEYYAVSESTVRRRLRERRNGDGTFPIPIFGFGRVARWRRSDIENWCEAVPEVIVAETPAQQNHKIEVAQRGL